MQRISWFLAFCITVSIAVAQVLAPAEIRDPELRALQEKHMADLKSVATAVTSHQFPYHFVLSRKLDVSEDQEKYLDQRSIVFARFQNQIVLQVTGNYYAAYSGELMTREERARQTVTDVMVPILKAEAATMLAETSIQSFALEISHHVRKKALGAGVERWENVVLLLPREDARRLLSGDPTAALNTASVMIDGQETAVFKRAEPVVVASRPLSLAMKPAPSPVVEATRDRFATPTVPSTTSPEMSQKLQSTYQDVLNRMVRDLDATARFVGYAPPSFINFHKGNYLQLSFTTPLPATASDSRYRLAALAFDEHVARLIRPLMAYFKDDPTFDGIDFSTTIKTDGKASDGGGVAVEYIFGIPSLRCYEQYDCTGQQIVNSGFVLINGERVSLDLQSAETGTVK